MQIHGIASLAGIGFTMWLFIGGLGSGDPELMNQTRPGVLTGPIMSGLLGYGALMFAT